MEVVVLVKLRAAICVKAKNNLRFMSAMMFLSPQLCGRYLWVIKLNWGPYIHTPTIND
jgi:hypothetical protein